MGYPLSRTISWALAMGLVLAHLYPAAAGLLVCLGDRANPSCCDEVTASRSRIDAAAQDLDDSRCGCCITVEAASNRADATPQKISVNVAFESDLPRSAVAPAAVRVARAGGDGPGGPRLSSLRTVVLLI